jgi:hypothetical protein
MEVRDEMRPAAKAATLWRNRDYMWLWSGQVISTLGSTASTIIYPLLILALTGSPEAAGVAVRLHARWGSALRRGARMARFHGNGRVVLDAAHCTGSRDGAESASAPRRSDRAPTGRVISIAPMPGNCPKSYSVERNFGLTL